jgi:hypothetical protein
VASTATKEGQLQAKESFSLFSRDILAHQIFKIGISNHACREHDDDDDDDATTGYTKALLLLQ